MKKRTRRPRRKTTCNVNFGKVQNKSVKVFQGDTARNDIEIIGQSGSYSIWTDPNSTAFSGLRGKSGNLSEVKKAINNALCSDSIGSASDPGKAASTAPTPGNSAPAKEPVSAGTTPKDCTC